MAVDPRQAARPLLSTRERAGRLAAIIGVILLHLTAYYIVTRVNSGRPVDALWDPRLRADDWIPHLPWSWVFYWTAYPYLTLVAATVIWRLPAGSFHRSIQAFVVLTLVGAGIQLALPIEAPWPEAAHPMQRLMHESALTRPYASLPSMHVAYSVLTACLGVAIARRGLLKVLHVVTAMLIILSTLTLKEHFVLDSATGALLGMLAAGWWRLGSRLDEERALSTERGWTGATGSDAAAVEARPWRRTVD
ncbi:MAG: phosphatase PAP2 family protein [Gemmatimonadota bacterium]